MAAREELGAQIEQKALSLGYVACAFTTCDPFPEFQDELGERPGYERFAGGGLSGDITGKEPNAEATCIISLIDSFAHIAFPPNMTPHIARAYLAKLYGGIAPGTNAEKHHALRDYLHELGIRTFDEKGFMQVPDRAVAARAGLVTYGKNNFAYHGDHGSLIIITNILVDADLPTEVHEFRCTCPPDCRACIDACPTRAMDDQGRLNPTKCVLYNNMFPDALLDASLRPMLGERIHGCDECQAACPRNKQAFYGEGKQADPLLEEIAPLFSLEHVLLDGEERFNQTTGRIISPYFKDYARHQRNAAIAMGNSGNTSYIPSLEQALADCENEETRSAILWALNRLKRANGDGSNII